MHYGAYFTQVLIHQHRSYTALTEYKNLNQSKPQLLKSHQDIILTWHFIRLVEVAIKLEQKWENHLDTETFSIELKNYLTFSQIYFTISPNQIPNEP